MEITEIELSAFLRYGRGHSFFNKDRAMTKESFMVEDISKDIILILMKERKMDMHEALRTLYTSETYSRLINSATGLYTQSHSYIYEYLEKELTTGKL